MKLVQFDQLNGSVEYEQIAYQLQKSIHMVEQFPTHSPSIIYNLGGVSRLCFPGTEYTVQSFSMMYPIQN